MEALAVKGCIGLLFANTPKAIAPWGGRKAVFGTNRLLDDPGVHDRDAVGHRERLVLVMGDVHEGRAELVLEAPLSLLRHRDRHVVGLEVDRAGLAGHPFK